MSVLARRLVQSHAKFPAQAKSRLRQHQGEELSKDIPHKLNSFISNQIHASDRSFIFTPINAENVSNVTSKFKSSHGFGIDSISGLSLKKGMSILANSLSQIFTLSLPFGKFPDTWRNAGVAPVYKDSS